MLKVAFKFNLQYIKKCHCSLYVLFFCKNNSYNKNEVKTKQKNKNKLRIVQAGMLQNKNINLSLFHKIKYC